MATTGRQTHLFTIRVWNEALGQEEGDVRFKVQHVLSREVRYFRGWPLLQEFVMSVVERSAGDIQPPTD